jgi:hypothetical protein
MPAAECSRVTDRVCPRGRGVEQQHTEAATRGSYVELVPDRLRQKEGLRASLCHRPVRCMHVHV